jgi:hypothetical protein
MFRIQDEPLYWWPVKVRRPSESKPGEMEEMEFEAQFRWLSDSRHDALIQECIEAKLLVAEVVPRVVVSFRKVLAENGEPLAAGPEGLQRLLAQQGVPRALWETYLASRDKAAEKNS